MKKISLFLLMVGCLALAGCSKDAEINSFITELDSTTQEMVAKIDADASSAGIDEAQKVYDGRKSGLQSKWDAIKGARGFQVSDDAKKKLEASVTKNVTSLTTSMMKVSSDPDAIGKFQKLVKDYTDTFKP